MKARHSARLGTAPRHLDRPKQWVHTPWLLLGMLFITAFLMASQRMSPVSEDPGPRDPAGYSSHEP